MATLALFCLGAANAQCVERSPVYEAPLPLVTCMMCGQFAGAARWRCETGPRRVPA
jgi:hypothetical protein